MRNNNKKKENSGPIQWSCVQSSSSSSLIQNYLFLNVVHRTWCLLIIIMNTNTMMMIIIIKKKVVNIQILFSSFQFHSHRAQCLFFILFFFPQHKQQQFSCHQESTITTTTTAIFQMDSLDCAIIWIYMGRAHIDRHFIQFWSWWWWKSINQSIKQTIAWIQTNNNDRILFCEFFFHILFVCFRCTRIKQIEFKDIHTHRERKKRIVLWKFFNRRIVCFAYHLFVCFFFGTYQSINQSIDNNVTSTHTHIKMLFGTTTLKQETLTYFQPSVVLQHSQ